MEPSDSNGTVTMQHAVHHAISPLPCAPSVGSAGVRRPWEPVAAAAAAAEMPVVRWHVEHRHRRRRVGHPVPVPVDVDAAGHERVVRHRRARALVLVLQRQALVGGVGEGSRDPCRCVLPRC